MKKVNIYSENELKNLNMIMFKESLMDYYKSLLFILMDFQNFIRNSWKKKITVRKKKKTKRSTDIFRKWIQEYEYE